MALVSTDPVTEPNARMMVLRNLIVVEAPMAEAADVILDHLEEWLTLNESYGEGADGFREVLGRLGLFQDGAKPVPARYTQIRRYLEQPAESARSLVPDSGDFGTQAASFVTTLLRAEGLFKAGRHDEAILGLRQSLESMSNESLVFFLVSVVARHRAFCQCSHILDLWTDVIARLEAPRDRSIRSVGSIVACIGGCARGMRAFNPVEAEKLFQLAREKAEALPPDDSTLAWLQSEAGA